MPLGHCDASGHRSGVLGLAAHQSTGVGGPEFH
jgi:hypothetical protein